MNDVATRFYERNYERVRDTHDDSAWLAAMKAGNGRYSVAYEYLRDHPGLDVLELGCGYPSIPRFLAPLTKTYTVIDIAKDRFADLAGGSLRAIQANLDNDFPIESASVDVLMAMMVVEHLYDPFHSFAEIARVVRPGGRVFMNLPNIASFRCRIDLLLGRLPYTSVPDWFAVEEWDGSHLHYFTVDSVKRIARHVGLEVTAVRAVGGAMWLKRLRPQLFCHEITFGLRKPD
jgi:SAM-dependent methyltransferase